MQSLTQLECEKAVMDAVVKGDFSEAATLALRGFGDDILRFLRARLRSTGQAEDAFLQFSEDMWLGLSKFRWEISLRVWLFILARNAATRIGRAQRREVQLETDQACAQLLDRARTTTAVFMRTAVKDRMREIRQQLEDDEQVLLILRVDRRLEWKELALVLGEIGADASDDEKTRAATRLRARFQVTKRKLRRLAEEAGLISKRSDALGDVP